MTDRAYRFALVAVAPSVVDVGLLVLLRQGLGWMLVVADLVAIAVASVLSYVLHRTVTFRSDPYVRWTHAPGVFVVIAVAAAAVDVVVLRTLFATTGYDTVGGLVLAKLMALSCAAALRLVAYRGVLMVHLTSARRVRADRPTAPGSVAVSLVIPALDEADRIGEAVATFRSGLGPLLGAGGLEVIVVDDGSRDGTADRALAADADQVVVLAQNRGKGAAVRVGALSARGRTVAFTDADMAYGPEQVHRVVGQVEQGWDMAIGNRRHPDAPAQVGHSRLRAWGSRLVNLLVYLVLLGNFRDTQCGLKAFRSDVAVAVFERARVEGFAFDIEVLHLAERHGFSVAEVPVDVAPSTRSTVRPFRELRRLVADLGRIRHQSATGAYELTDVDDLPEVIDR